MTENIEGYDKCSLCPRRCGVRRSVTKGFCGAGNVPVLNLYMPHFGEEPPISGSKGSGAMFFEGCPMHCIFCQNGHISRGLTGKGMICGEHKLVEIFFELRDLGVHNINLVTPLHYAPHIERAVRLAKDQGFDLPFVLNSGGYESVETLKMFEGLIDIYLPDFKFWDSRLAAACAKAPDYRETAVKAIEEMFRQTGKAQIDPDTGLLKKGMIVRHLMIPSKLFDTKKILDHLTSRYGNDIYISLMNQYTPMPHLHKIKDVPPYLLKKVREGHYEAAVDYLAQKGQINAFVQEDDASGDSMIPDFKY